VNPLLSDVYRGIFRRTSIIAQTDDRQFIRFPSTGVRELRAPEKLAPPDAAPWRAQAEIDFGRLFLQKTGPSRFLTESTANSLSLVSSGFSATRRGGPLCTYLPSSLPPFFFLRTTFPPGPTPLRLIAAGGRLALSCDSRAVSPVPTRRSPPTRSPPTRRLTCNR